MLFTDVVFPPFLIVTLLLFAAAARYRRAQLLIFLAASYVFYGWWDARFLGLIVFSSLLDFVVGARLARAEAPRRRRQLLAVSLAGNLGVLGYFKYANFFVDNTVELLAAVGFEASRPTLDVVLPVGISFYTFQSLSYTFDIYSRKLEPSRSLLEFMVFVAAFPQLVAGPIVRAREFLPQLAGNLFARSDSSGLFYIFYGLAKKIFVADYLGARIVDHVFAATGSSYAIDAWLGMYAFSFQLFLDFSAYSDIAVGLGLLFGMKLPVNFRSPYHAANPSEFWHRWHITLSQWFRDYVYIPLGGNRVPEWALLRNLFVTMILSGLWHGAAWTFVLWGGLHATALVVHRAWIDHRRRRGFEPREATGIRWLLYVILFFHLQALFTIFFRASDVSSGLELMSRLFAVSL